MSNEDKILQMLTQMQEDIATIKEQQEVHTRSITTLENSVMHELKLLNENLPNAITKAEKVDEIANTVDEYGNRIFALEQKVAN